MIKGGKGGASTKTGLVFEERADLAKQLEKIPNYEVIGNVVFYKNEKVAYLLSKYKLYKEFLKPKGIEWENIISARLLPDEALYVINEKELFIMEKKFQQSSGSVDEKLQTCDFKKKQYAKLLSPLGIEVDFSFILSEWFKQPRFKDVFVYIQESGCNYFFEEIPLEHLGLPIPN